MARPAPKDLIPGPERCPECGSRDLGPVRPADVEVAPLDPEDAPDPYPGLLVCRRCGATVEWDA